MKGENKEVIVIYPDESKYIKDTKEYNVIPVFSEFRADFETPLSIFLKVKAKFLLESIERGENVGRYSFITIGKKSVIKIKGRNIEITEYERDEIFNQESTEQKNPLKKVREYFSRFKTPEYDGLPPFSGGAIGYLGYETVQYFEDIPTNDGDESIPDGFMIIPEVLVVYDSIKRSASVIVSTMPGKNPGSSYQRALEMIDEVSVALSKPLLYKPFLNESDDNISLHNHMEKEYFLECVKKCKDYIVNGEIIQAVFSQKFTLETDASPFELYRTLRILNPSPYLFFLDFDDFCILGSSPEVMVRVQNDEILLKPIAGTRERGTSMTEDNSIAKELIEDPKERSEHMMLVDLGRNDLGRVAVSGSVEVTDFMSIEKYSHVMHIVSTIKGILDKQFDVFDVIRATFPAGTLTGAPKVRAMENIAELEHDKRGPYGGMIFNLGFNGNMDSCITIRTIILKDKKVMIQAGAGIVADSVPEREYTETLNKAQALIDTIKSTNTGRAK